MKENPLKKIVTMQKQGKAVGIYSACSANEYVIAAVLERAAKENSVALIEATANQCDQNGGYTGMTPKDFMNYVKSFAKSVGLSEEKLFLGGDHLGPLTWSHLAEDKAMKNAEELIRQYILAGFTKIHIDTSMKLASDNAKTRLSDETIAKRGARLANIANASYQELLKENPNAIKPVYIVGSEVPIPGGAQGEDSGEELKVTTVSDFKSTIKTFQEAFEKENILNIWDDVIAVVVQPGVEEKDSGCVEYNREKAKELMSAIKDYPTLVYEGHSTDYQTKNKLKELVEDGVGILKVGPGLTFAMREGLFALANIEQELLQENASQFIKVLENEMLEHPDKWISYYNGNDNELRIKRKFSFSDRCRYYMPSLVINAAKHTLFKNLSMLPEIPLNLLSQFMPIQYTKVREGKIKNTPEALLKDRIANTIDEYLYATNQQLL